MLLCRSMKRAPNKQKLIDVDSKRKSVENQFADSSGIKLSIVI
jgi:hypothetical protein